MTLLGPYRVERELGSGGAGTVYAARSPDGRSVAVKVLRRELSDDPVRAARFAREALALARLSHPGIVPVLASGTLDDGRPWLSMPLLSGRSLRAALGAQGAARSLRETWAIVREVALALGCAHAEGIVHRDVKPDNIFLELQANGRERPRLLDFGHARVMEPSGPALTDSGAPVGTPGYMAPEQWWNDGVGPATDQYALGVLAFELATGRLPFPCEGYVAQMQAHLTAPPPTFASAGVPASDAAEAWLSRALAKAPGERFSAMEALVRDGDLAFGGSAGGPLPSPARDGRAARALIGLAGPLGLALVGYAGSHDPRGWARLAGWGFVPMVVAFVAALVITVRASGRPRLVTAALPGLLGALGAGTGWQAVLHHLQRIPESERFEVFNEGMSEADVNRFVGYGLAASVLAASLSGRRAEGAREPHARREGLAITASGLVAALIALVAGAPSASACAVALTLVVLAWGAPSRDPEEELSRAGRALLAMGLAALSAYARADARGAVAWALSPTRAARALELTAAAAERGATLTFGVVAVALVAGWGAVRVRRHAPERLPSLSKGARWTLALVALWALGDALVAARVSAGRSALWASLGPQFALYSRLDPPSGAGLPRPHLAPSLQLSRDVVALDAARVGLVNALDQPEGTAALALDLSHRLAREGGVSEGAAGLLVLVDRSVRWRSVARALGVAWGLGVRRAEVLLTRGPGPRPGTRAPPEASWALPRDFGAVRVELLDAPSPGGVSFPPEARFETVAGELAERGRRGVVRLRVSR